MENREKLIKGLEIGGIAIDSGVADKLIAYMVEVLKRNEQINLTAIRDVDEFIEKQLIDSLLIGRRKEFISSDRIIDMGTGAGFPGVPLAIVYTHKHFTLADSLKKRLKIVDELCEKLEIGNVETVHGRAETLGRDEDFRECYDMAVSKAVAQLNVLSEYCLPLVRKGGFFISYKGKNAEEEINKSKKAIKSLGGAIIEVDENVYKGYEDIKEHRLVIVKKTESTPKKYPRSEGKPSKEPIE